MGIIRVRTSGLGEVTPLSTMQAKRELYMGLFNSITNAANALQSYYRVVKESPSVQPAMEQEFEKLKTLVSQSADFALEVAKNPAPLTFELAFLTAWRRGDCYIRVFTQGGEFPFVIPPLVITPSGEPTTAAPVDTPPTPTEGAQVEAEPSEDVIVTEDGAVTDGSTLGKVPWWAWLVLGYAGYRVYKRK